MSAHIFRMTAMAVLVLVSMGQLVEAQSLFGSGAMQGGMICPYETRTSRAAVNMGDEEREERQRISQLRARLQRAEGKKELAEANRERLRVRIERYFDSEVANFLMDEHIEVSRNCDQYQSVANRCLPGAAATPAPAAPPAEGAPADAAVSAAPAVDCNSKIAVPELLVGKWTEAQGGRGNYCRRSTSRDNLGSVNPAICNDEALRPTSETGRRSRRVNTAQCVRDLADYRKNTVAQDNAQQEVEDLEMEIEEREFNIADARQRADIERRYRMRNETEAGSDCADCDAYNRGYSQSRPRRDWGSTITNVVGGLGLMYIGRRAENAAAEQAAQLGYPADSSYGYPFYKAGIAGVINGLAGPGAYGCASTVGGGGFPYGANGMLGVNGNLNGANSVFGPFGAQGGAFGYPPNMHGAPWLGGAFNPGININGGFNGPFGGVGGQVGFPQNGNMALCITFPCNVGGQGGLGGQFNLGGGLGGLGGLGGGFGGGFGGPQFGGPFGLNGQFSAQYQLQMLQQQQQMQQQYLQQQQQYYQMQYQQQMAYYQQLQQRQQQTYQIQQQIAQLTLQLQQLQYSNGIGGAGFGIGGGLSGGISIGIGGGGGFTGGFGGGPIGAPLPGGFNPGLQPGFNPGFQQPGFQQPGFNPGVPGGIPNQPVNGGRGR